MEEIPTVEAGDAGTAENTSGDAVETASKDSGQNTVARVTRIVLIICALFFVWYLVADRFTPLTSQARVRGRIVPVVPEVAGVIVDVLVDVNEVVIGGQPLFRIDSSDYDLAVARAEADLEQAGQEGGAATADVAGAQAELANATVILQNVEIDANRIFTLGEQRLVPEAQVVRAQTRLDEAKGTVANAQANLDRAREQLGAEGQNNPRVREALAALELVRLDLARTTVYSPTSGGISNLRLSAGYYAQPGQALTTFISDQDVWIEAYLRENSIGNVRPGQPVDITLDVAPGRIFAGEVVSLGYGVSTGQDTAVGALPTVAPSGGWLREPQRFPVVIRFSDNETVGLRREGGQAAVIVYTSGNWIVNALGWVAIRLVALFSYLH